MLTHVAWQRLWAFQVTAAIAQKLQKRFVTPGVGAVSARRAYSPQKTQMPAFVSAVPSAAKLSCPGRLTTKPALDLRVTVRIGFTQCALQLHEKFLLALSLRTLRAWFRSSLLLDMFSCMTIFNLHWEIRHVTHGYSNTPQLHEPKITRKFDSRLPYASIHDKTEL